MAWTENTGQHRWRARCLRDDGRYGSVSGFDSKKAAETYADDLESDRRRGRWFDPTAAKITVSTWSGVWVETLDVETRTDENYRAYLRNHILPRWGYTALGDITLDVTVGQKNLRNTWPSPPSTGSSPCSP